MKKISVACNSGNMTAEVGKLIASLVPGEAAEISFEKGIYNFFREGSATTDRAVNATIRSEKNYAFLLDDLSDIIIDGNGSEFIFHDRMFPFAMFGCRNVILRNFTIDFSFSRYAQGKVLTSDESSFELEIDEELFPHEITPEGFLYFIGNGERFPKTPGGKILLGNGFHGKKPWNYLFCGNSDEDRSNLPVKYIETDAVKTAGGVRFIYKPDSFRLCFDPGDTLTFGYERRINVNIMSQSCKDIRVENVSIYRGGGMGIVASDTENFTAYGVKIQVRPGRNECRSTTADGFYFVQCRGKVTLDNCLISQTNDDALNIHGVYTVVSEIVSPDTVKLFHASNDNHHGIAPCRPGDVLAVNDQTTHRFIRTVKVLSCEEEDPLHYLVKVDCAGALEIGNVLENETAAADFEMKNCVVDRCPNCRISDNGKIRIHDNRFEKLSAIVVMDLFKYWYESGAVTDMSIENNQFFDTPRNKGCHPIVVWSTRDETHNVLHKNLTIRNNRFVRCGNSTKPLLLLHWIENITVTGNQTDNGNRTAEFINCKNIVCDDTDAVQE